MSELTNLRGLGAVLGAAFGSALGIVLVLLVVFLTPAFGIRWPVPHDVVLLAAFGLPIFLTALIGVRFGPAAPSWWRRVSVGLRGDQTAFEATGTETNRSLVLHVSRGFTVIYLMLGLVMTVLGVFVVVIGSTSMGILAMLTGWACLLFFGGITVLLLIQFTWPTRFGLTLETDGFTVRMNLGSRRYRWADVERFFPYNTVALQPVVAFKYRGKAEIHGLQWTRGVFRTFDGTLPQNLSIRGVALLDLMERWRSQATGTDR
jgi:MFS family permease